VYSSFHGAGPQCARAAGPSRGTSRAQAFLPGASGPYNTILL
jgi:hypothetical protein